MKGLSPIYMDVEPLTSFITHWSNLVLVLLGWGWLEERISCARTKDLGTTDYKRAPRPPRATPPPAGAPKCSQVLPTKYSATWTTMFA